MLLFSSNMIAPPNEFDPSTEFSTKVQLTIFISELLAAIAPPPAFSPAELDVLFLKVQFNIYALELS